MAFSTPTFERLSTDKKERFINAFFKEFTIHKFDDASVSRVLRALKIAKGSFYQYFLDKTALYFYLIELCGSEKRKFQIRVQRADYNDFWEYWNALYNMGYDFDQVNPIMSNFMLQLYNSSNSPTLITHFEKQQKQAVTAIAAMIHAEQEAGFFRTDLSAKALAYHLYRTNQGLFDQLQLEFKTEFNERMVMGKPLFGGEIYNYYEAIKKDAMCLLKSAFAQNNY